MNTRVTDIQLGVVNLKSLYETTVENIELILKKRYKMNSNDAKKAIAISPLKSIFDENEEMAAHTSNETWARQIYSYWNRQN